MKTLAYIRVSTDKQDLKNQKLEVLDYAHRNDFRIDEFIEIEISSRKSTKKRKIDELIERLRENDTLIVSDLSRIGRSTGEVINTVNTLIEKHVRLIAIKQNLVVNDKHDIQSKVIITMFSLFAELERDLISQRTKQALEAKKALGVRLGRPKGSLGVSKIDDKKEEIQELLKHRVAKSAIARMLGVSRTTLIDFIKSRNLCST